MTITTTTTTTVVAGYIPAASLIAIVLMLYILRSLEKLPKKGATAWWATRSFFQAKRERHATSLTSGEDDSTSEDDDDEAEEDSIFLAISTHFCLEKHEEQKHQEQSSSDHRPDGLLPTMTNNRIVARILERNDVEYEKHKPIEQRVDSETKLRTVLESDVRLLDGSVEPQLQPRRKEEKDMVVALQVDAVLPSACKPGICYRLKMNMLRDSKEPAHKTLRRLSISLERKVRSEERKLDPTQNYPRNPDKDYYYHFGRSRGQRDPGVSTTVWVLGGDHHLVSQTETETGTETDQDGYSRYHVPRDQSIAQLWEMLQNNFQSSKVCIHFNNDDDDDDETNTEDACIFLPIVACPPTITSVSTFENFHSQIFVGVPLVVEVEVHHAARAVVAWFVDGTLVCLDSSVYTPTCHDVGKQVSVLIVPVRPGLVGIGTEEAYEFANKVEPLPTMPLVSPLRDHWIVDKATDKQRRRGHELRVMTYNLLADTYASRETDQAIMYNHCAAPFLRKKRRMPMLLYEMLAFLPDIICLQEVDATVFADLFRPVMESQGYQGYYSNKASAQMEGCAMFWSLERFHSAEPASMREYYLKDLFRDHTHQLLDRWESLDDIDQILEQNSELGLITKEKIGQVLQLAELSLLAPEAGQPDRVLIGNTHLFYHPLANHVRTMQAYMICRQMEIERHRYCAGLPCPLVFCGDFNSSPLSGALTLMLQKRVGPDNYDVWKHLHDYQWGMGGEEFLLEHGYIGNEADSGVPLYEDEAFEDALESLADGDSDSSTSPLPQLRLPPNFPKLVSAYPVIPEFTNYAVDFSETLDYILVSVPSPTEIVGLLPVRAAPIPSAATVKAYGAMPNEGMPSDHVSLLCDLEWGQYATDST